MVCDARNSACNTAAGDYPPAPPALWEFVKSFRAHATAFTDLRKYVRHKMFAEVVTRPLDSSLQQTSPTFTALTNDVSQSGISLFSTICVRDPFLAISLRLEKELIQKTVEVVRCRPVRGFFHIAGRFRDTVAEPTEDRGTCACGDPESHGTPVEQPT